LSYLSALPESDWSWLGWGADQSKYYVSQLPSYHQSARRAIDDFNKVFGRDITLIDNTGYALLPVRLFSMCRDVYEFLKGKKLTSLNQVNDAWGNSIGTVLRNLTYKLSNENAGGETLKKQLLIDWSKNAIGVRVVDQPNPPGVFLENGMFFILLLFLGSFCFYLLFLFSFIYCVVCC
jgi:hypothetical protein